MASVFLEIMALLIFFEATVSCIMPNAKDALQLSPDHHFVMPLVVTQASHCLIVECVRVCPSALDMKSVQDEEVTGKRRPMFPCRVCSSIGRHRRGTRGQSWSWLVAETS